MQSHFLKTSYRRRKAVASSSALMLLVTPTKAFLRLSWCKLRPASFYFTFIKRMKLAGARFSKLGSVWDTGWHRWRTNPALRRQNAWERCPRGKTAPWGGVAVTSPLWPCLPPISKSVHGSCFPDNCSSYKGKHFLLSHATSHINSLWVIGLVRFESGLTSYIVIFLCTASSRILRKMKLVYKKLPMGGVVYMARCKEILRRLYP
jgi:hypothetical protein